MSGGRVTWSSVRESNAALVLDVIRGDPPLSRAEVARRTKLSKPTVGSVLTDLLAAGLVREVSAPNETHYRAVYFEPASDAAFVLGLDIGRRYVRGLLADLDGAPLDRHDVRLGDCAPHTVMSAVRRIRAEIADDLPIELVVAGAPGVVGADGLLRASNAHELEGFAIAAELAATLGAAVQVENDVNLATLGEQEAGHGRGVADFAYLSVGTGVGAGLILGGRPFRGHRGAAGEVDAPPPGRDLAPGSPSADALLGWAADWIAAEGSDLAVAPEAIYAAAARDELAGRIVAEQARRIAARIAEISRVVDVELVVLGGGIGLASRGSLAAIAAAVGELAHHPPRLEISALGDAAVLVGAIISGGQRAWQQIAARNIARGV
ncbi:ROK family transcriptional regulator [Nonomuraea sp. NPDC050556]|uniref:ROK family transcriptional regulator n=1 Tax=Nonomuraea sp. NPDC050556 TaxID=3364369 RepID=UPI0037BC968B